ncbi:MAG TPA: DUF4136 domain-containing protein [Gemmatimonadaceae bacterium]|nr:DUF4136 domain-containing protein [Gemmatimonadaceae bacterium]
MFSAARIAAAAALTFLVVGCGPSIEVRTIAAPDASFPSLHSFRMLAGPARRDGRAMANDDDDPMIANSIANRAMHDEIRQAFIGRGYEVKDAADFGVAFYAASRQKLDVTAWSYGYPYTPGFPPRGLFTPQQTVSEYTEGTVIVDVIRLDTHQLLWRGMGVATLDDNPTRDLAQLRKAAAAIVAKFPRATVPVVAAR